MKKKIFGYLIW